MSMLTATQGIVSHFDFIIFKFLRRDGDVAHFPYMQRVLDPATVHKTIDFYYFLQVNRTLLYSN